MRARPFERGNERAVLGDVVGRDANRVAELFDRRSVRLLDADAIAGRSGVAPRAAVDVRDDPVSWSERGHRPPESEGPALSDVVLTGVEGSRCRLPDAVGCGGRR